MVRRSSRSAKQLAIDIVCRNSCSSSSMEEEPRDVEESSPNRGPDECDQRHQEAVGAPSASPVRTETSYNSAFFAALSSVEKKYAGQTDDQERATPTRANRADRPGTSMEFKTPEVSSSFLQDTFPEGTPDGQIIYPIHSPIQGVIEHGTTSMSKNKDAGTPFFPPVDGESTPNSSFMASLDRHMQAAEHLLQSRSTDAKTQTLVTTTNESVEGSLDQSRLGEKIQQSLLEISGQAHGHSLRSALKEQKNANGCESIGDRVNDGLDAQFHCSSARMDMGSCDKKNKNNRDYQSARQMLTDVQQSAVVQQEIEAYLPEECCRAFREGGLKNKLYPWQAECLCRPGVLQGKNLVYCAPTSAGKSLVADILLIRHIIATGCIGMIVLPFVALCREKSTIMEKLLEPTGKLVRNHFGVEGSRKIIQPDTGILICTIEKANLLVSRLAEEEALDRLGIVVVDELHMVGDEHRGYLLELLLTKLRYATIVNQEEAGLCTHAGLQVIGMSATMSNGPEIAKWLDAELFETDFRPVPLKQYIKVGKVLKDAKMEFVRTICCDQQWETRDPDHVGFLAKETIDSGHSVLIFCCSKKSCEDTAKKLKSILTVPERTIGQTEVGWNREKIIEHLNQIYGGPAAGLTEAIANGTAFHHAGLSIDERDLVETAFKCGAVSVLTATSTVAAGVNLPARRVIFKHPYVGIKDNLLDATRYRQMSGRAGRAGIDTLGESILIATNNVSVEKVKDIILSKSVPIESCLSEERRGMRRAVLEVVASGAVRSPNDVERYIRSTLLAATKDFQDVVAMATKESLKWLSTNAFLRWNSNGTWSPMALGKATLASSLSPSDGLTVKRDLEKAREGLVMSTDLHLTFLVSPIGNEVNIDWRSYFNMYRSMKGPDAAVAGLVGVDYAMMQHLAMGTDFRNEPESSPRSEQIRVAKRFYGALVLHDVIQEVPFAQITARYGIDRGNIQALQDRSGRFASMVAAFCERMGWSDLESLVAKFQGRVWSGVRQEILVLTEIPHVKAHRARILFRAGLRTVESVAAMESVNQLAAILAKGTVQKGRSYAEQIANEQIAARRIIRGAQELLLARAKELQDQANAALDSCPKSTMDMSSPGIVEFSIGSEAQEVNGQDHIPSSSTKRFATGEPPGNSRPKKKHGSLEFTPRDHPKDRILWKNQVNSDIWIVDSAEDCKKLSSLLLSMSMFGYDFACGPSSTSMPLKSNLAIPGGPLKLGVPVHTNKWSRNLPLFHGVGFYWKGGNGAYVELREPNLSFKVDLLDKALGNASAEKITWDAKKQMKLLHMVEGCKSLTIVHPVIDVRVAAWMRTPDAAEVADCSANQRPSSTLKNLLDSAGLGDSVELTSYHMNARKACKKASDALHLYCDFQRPQLELENLQAPMMNIELPLMRVLAHMERAGIGFDARICQQQEVPLKRRVDELVHQAQTLAGYKFNLLSPPDVSKVLFEELGLVPPPCAKEAGKKRLSTRAEVLSELCMEHPLPAIILEHRKLSKLLLGFSQYLSNWVSEGHIPESTRLYGCYNQTATATGRLSMDDPNLQNIPKPVHFEAQVTQTPPDNAPGDRPNREYVCSIRAAFIAPPGCIMVSADFRQIELRIMAHFSKDSSLCTILNDPVGDPFRRLAAQWQQCSESEVTLLQRDHAKRLMYGLLYGMGPHALAQELGTELERAVDLSNSFQHSLPGVEEWLTKVKEDCRKNQYIETLKGRRRYLPEINDTNWSIRSHAERQAVNSICQGSAADLVKVSMIDLHEKLPAPVVMVHQIHDELLFEMPANGVDAQITLIKQVMENAVNLSVPTPVRIQTGSSWGSLEEWPNSSS